MTRIDAHLLNRAGVTRLCYCGNVLHARPADLLSSRELLQIGAEIYGHAGFEADLEIIQLVLETVAIAGVRNPRLDLCHPGVLRAILESDPVAESLSEALFPLLREKDVPGLVELARRAPGLRDETLNALRLLPNLYGGPGAEAGAPRTAAVARRGGGAGRAAGADRCDARHGIQHRPGRCWRLWLSLGREVRALR